jgi:hypothetical protein
VARWLNEWRNDQWIAALESLDPEDQSLWRMIKRVMRVHILSPLVNPERIALSDSEKAEALADSLETQFQPVTDPSVPGITEMVAVALRSYFLTNAAEFKLTKPDKIHESVWGFKVSNVPCANGIPNRDVKNLPQRALSLQCWIFNAVLRTHHFPEVCKHASCDLYP